MASNSDSALEVRCKQNVSFGHNARHGDDWGWLWAWSLLHAASVYCPVVLVLIGYDNIEPPKLTAAVWGCGRTTNKSVGMIQKTLEEENKGNEKKVITNPVHQNASHDL